MARLVPAEQIDAAQMLAWRSDPDVTEHLARTTWSREDVDRWLDSLGDTRRAYGIEADGQIIGFASLDDIDETNRKCQAGVIIGDSRYWGRGIGTEVAGLVTEVAFQKLGLHRVLTVASERNPVSIHPIRPKNGVSSLRVLHAEGLPFRAARRPSRAARAGPRNRRRASC